MCSSDLLNKEFYRNAYVVPNGIDTTVFNPNVPLVPKNGKRLRVLIEGPITVPFKGVAVAYTAIEPLDCEIWVVSSAGKPDANWRVDRFFEAVSHEDMPKIYSSCDILLKMSRIESFSYPPIEAMACGCAVVVGRVLGSIEYVIDGVNALVVAPGVVSGARDAVKRLLEDFELRTSLVNEGFKTANNWSWGRSYDAMLRVVSGMSS